MQEKDFYGELANWSFDDIDYTTQSFTNWSYEEEIKKHVNPDSKVLDLGTAAGEKVLKYFPDCAEILGTDYSAAMIANANKNLIASGRANISFRVMDNLKMDVPKNYFDVVTARHTVTDPAQIYQALKDNGYLILRGVDKLDCWALKRTFNMGQSYDDSKPISLIDYEAILDAGFKNVELIPIHDVEYYKTKEDLLALLLKAPILTDFSEEENYFEKPGPIDNELLDYYIKENTADQGIKLVRRYYGITGQKK